jgi:hypothetical protein
LTCRYEDATAEPEQTDRRETLMKKIIVFLTAALALAVPAGVALAKAPATHTNQSKAAPKVMYILKGTLTAYTAATSTQDGSVTIDVTHSNYHARALRNGPPLTFDVSTKTKITFVNGATTLNVPARGMVKFRAPRKVSGDLATVLPTIAHALHIIDTARH